jgi:hypothetical protein
LGKLSTAKKQTLDDVGLFVFIFFFLGERDAAARGERSWSWVPLVSVDGSVALSTL